MAFRLPTFNVQVNLWAFGVAVTDPPRNSPFGNFGPGRRVVTGDAVPEDPAIWVQGMYLLVPTGTVIVGHVDSGGSPDTLEVPAGSGRFYTVRFVDFSGLGFANEHLFAICGRLSGPPAPPESELLLETSGSLDLEDGTAILLE